MKLAIFTLSTPGAEVAQHLLTAMPEARLFVHRDVPGYEHVPRFGRIAEQTAKCFERYDGLIYIMPTGVVVRAIASHLTDKKRDPAVVAIDIGGRWAVSLLSGHEGGANVLCNRVANALDAEAMISTSTEARRSIIAGVGCRRGTTAGSIIAAIDIALENIHARRDCLRMLASVQAKVDEAGLIDAAAELELPLRIIGDERIRALGPAVTPTAAARHLGLPAVAEPAALLGGWRTTLCLPTMKHQGVTVALAREACPWSASDPAAAPIVPPLP